MAVSVSTLYDSGAGVLRYIVADALGVSVGGNTGLLVSSTDEETFTSRSSGTTGNFRDGASSGTHHAHLVGKGLSISSDLVNWTYKTPYWLGQRDMYGVNWSARRSRWELGGDYGQRMYSDDNFDSMASLASLPSAEDIYMLCDGYSGPSAQVMIAQGGKIYRTTTFLGTFYLMYETGGDYLWTLRRFSNTLYVACGDNGHLVVSDGDDASWTQATPFTADRVWDVGQLASGKYYCVTQGGEIYSSDDLLSWALEDSGYQTLIVCTSNNAGDKLYFTQNNPGILYSLEEAAAAVGGWPMACSMMSRSMYKQLKRGTVQIEPGVFQLISIASRYGYWNPSTNEIVRDSTVARVGGYVVDQLEDKYGSGVVEVCNAYIGDENAFRNYIPGSTPQESTNDFPLMYYDTELGQYEPVGFWLKSNASFAMELDYVEHR